MPRSLLLLPSIAFFLLICFNCFASTLPSSLNKAKNLHINKAFAKSPLRFEKNEGQTDEQVKFLSRGAGYAMYLTPTEAVMVISGETGGTKHTPLKPENAKKTADAIKTESAVIRMKLIGSSPDPIISGLEKQATRSHYFTGNDPSKWKTGVANFGKVKYEEVYPGIDLVFYGNQRKLEYDFVVKTGADPKKINWNFDGADKISIDTLGNLILKTPVGDFVQHAPVIYQTIDGERKPIEGRYVLAGNHHVTFQVAEYDTTKELIIDPVLTYSTYLGAVGGEQGEGIALDTSGNVYIVGWANSIDFPIMNPTQVNQPGDDAVITKLDPSGAIVYSSYLGGSGEDRGKAISVDVLGNIYVTGYTTSSDFPTLNPVHSYQVGDDAFVTKLDPAGVIVYSTFLGGNDSDRGTGIASDASGNAYITGFTVSTDFPLLNFVQGDQPESDAFVTKLDPAGGVVYSTYFGGSSLDHGHGIAVDGSGNAYIIGLTQSTDFPLLNPIQTDQPRDDACLFQLNPSGALVFSTYLGGSGSDTGFGIAIDDFGNIYLVGNTHSPDFPTLNPAQQNYHPFFTDAFVMKLNPSHEMVYSTFLGGNNGDTGSAIATDKFGNAYTTGFTNSNDFPRVNPIPEENLGHGAAFTTKLTPSGKIVFSTYFGGNNVDKGTGIVSDNFGNVYITGYTESNNFPLVNPIHGDMPFTDIFISRISSPPNHIVVKNDFDGDGDSDLLLVHENGTVVSVLIENSVYQSHGLLLELDPLQGWAVNSTGDLNGDTKADLLLYNSTTGEYRIILLDGVNVLNDNIPFTIDPLIGLEPRGIRDFDGDGKAEVFLYQPATGVTGLVYLFENAFSSFEEAAQIDEANNWTFVDLADFTGNGKTDLLIQNTGTGETAIIEMDGSTSSPPVAVFTLPPAMGITVEDTGDFNGDGNTDILGVQLSSGALIPLLMDGLVYQSTYVPGNMPAGFELVNPGIYSGDNLADFLVYNDSSGELASFYQDGALVNLVNIVLNLGPASGWTYHKGKP